MPAAASTPVIHAPLRLQICAMLAAAATVDFATVREMLDVSGIRALQACEGAGGGRLRRVRKATSDGRRADLAGADVRRPQAFVATPRRSDLVGDLADRAAE